MDSNDKIKKLTDKIYLEGIEKANQDAELIISNAKKEAERIINNAKEREKEIIEQTHKRGEELKKNIESEIILAARQFTSKLKQQITRLITKAQVESPVKEAYNDKEFVQSIMLKIINNWHPQKHEGMDINLLLPEKDKEELSVFFNNKAKDFLNSGLEVNFLPTVKSGFKIGPKDKSYIISFTDTDFENYFKNHLKDKTRKMIFDN